MADIPGESPNVDGALNVEQDAPPAYPAKPSAPSAYAPAEDAPAIKTGSPQHDGDEDISDTDDEQPNVTDKQRAQVAAMYQQASSAAGSGGVAGPAVGKGDDSGTDTDEDGALIQKAKEGVKERMAMQIMSKPKGGGRARPGSGITLKMLVDEGMLTPGVGVLSVEYKGSVTVADLLDDGRIWWKGQTFESPSAFSIHIKRLVNPSRKADDGWKTVKYERRYLESFKVALSKQKFDGGDTAAAPEPRGTKRQRVVPAHLADAADVPTGRNGAAAAAGGANGAIDRLGLRRRAAPPASLGDDHQMVQLQQYRGPIGSGTRGAQPFTLQVSAAAEVMMDFHAHLSTHEVIGVLAGYFDPSNHIVRVMHAMPVKELPTENNNINVEMDPEDEHRAREMIQKLNMRCVGWYHSHPHFATMPSLIDVFNQVMQQQAHRDNSLLPYEPYVGAIIGPYDRHMSGTTSSLTWFTVEHPQGVFPGYQDNPLDVDCHPYELKTVPVYGMDNDITVLLQRSFPELAKRYARMRAGRPDMQEAWRDGLTRLDKLKASLRNRLPPSWTEGQAAAFVDKVNMAITGAWTMFQPPASAVLQPVASMPQPVAAPGMVPQPIATAGMVPQPVAAPGMVPQPVATAGMVPQPPPGQL